MYDAFGAQTAIPSGGYRNVGYARASANGVLVDISLAPATSVSTAADGGLTAFVAPTVATAAVASDNRYTLAMGNSAQMDLGRDPVSGIRWGRWQGGWTATHPSQGVISSEIHQGLHWFALPGQSQAAMLPITGRISYALAGATSPTDTVGTVGTLSAATLDANFTAQQVSVTLGVEMPASASNPAIRMDLTAERMPILPGANFGSSSPVITCTGCSGQTSAVIGGQFSQGGMGAGVGYGLQNGNQLINGAAVFHR